MPLLSLAHLTILPADPLQLIECAAQAGFDAIGLRIQPPLAGDTIVPVVGDREMQRAIRRRLRETSLSLLDIEAFWIMPDTDMIAFRDAFAIGAELGARFVLVVGNDPDRMRLADRFAQLCDHARANALIPMLEFIPYSEVRSLSDAHDLIVDTRATNAGLLVDALHLGRSGGSPADIALYAPELFHYMHLCDAPAAAPSRDGIRAEARGGRLYPGEGGLALARFISSFPAATPIAIEAPSARHRHLTLAEQAALAARSARAVIAQANGHG
jgi:sugar phosphate isomerase/epimerase